MIKFFTDAENIAFKETQYKENYHLATYENKNNF